MFTRLLTFTDATDIDAGIINLREEALPILEAQRGFRGVSASADRPGKLMTILSLWSTDGDRLASDSALGKARDEALELVGGSLEIENFEEVVEVITNPTPAGCVLNVARVRMEPVSIDADIAWFKEWIEPTIPKQPGFCALRVMVDWQTGGALSESVFETQEAADASLAGISAPSSAAEERGVTFESITQREVLLSQLF
jgi:hypothetical protein